MVVAVVQTENTVQLIVTWFAVLFPIYVATAFFYIVWHRNYVLYHPREYDTTKPGEFVEAMHSQRGLPISGEKQATAIEAAVQKAVTEVGPELVKALEEKARRAANLTVNEEITIETVEEVVEQTLNTAAKNAAERVRDELFIEVASSDDYAEEGGMLVHMTDLVPVDKFTTADQFVSYAIGATSEDPLPPNAFMEQFITYGQEWALRDETSGTIFRDMGPLWALSYGETEDKRSIFEMGLRPGMTLRRVSLAKRVPKGNPPQG